MEEIFVTYEIALELKELGFNEPCFGFYYNKNNFEIAKILDVEPKELLTEIKVSKTPAKLS